jgi:hypothetical protein
MVYIILNFFKSVMFYEAYFLVLRSYDLSRFWTAVIFWGGCFVFYVVTLRPDFYVIQVESMQIEVPGL